MHSIPISSDIRARRTFSSNSFCQRSGTLVAARPLEQLEPNTASLKRLPPNMVGLRSAAMAPLALALGQQEFAAGLDHRHAVEGDDVGRGVSLAPQFRQKGAGANHVDRR